MYRKSYESCPVDHNRTMKAVPTIENNVNIIDPRSVTRHVNEYFQESYT